MKKYKARIYHSEHGGRTVQFFAECFDKAVEEAQDKRGDDEDITTISRCYT